MGTDNPAYYRDVIGEKIIFEGEPAVIDGFESSYEGDFWYIDVKGEKPMYYKVPYFTPPGRYVAKEAERIRKERKEREENK